MFFLRKLTTILLMPLTASLLLIAAGIFLRLKTNKNRTGLSLITTGIIIFTLTSNLIFATMLIRPLENRYPEPAVPEKPLIVVLGSGVSDVPHLSPTSQISPIGLARMAEGIRLYHKAPDARLLFTAGDIGGGVILAEKMKEAAVSLGISGKDIIAIPEGRTTGEEARAVSEYLESNPEKRTRPIMLVTSASHLPRAVKLFEMQGIEVIPAPADFESLPGLAFRPSYFLPTPKALQISQRAIHEYLGLMLIYLQ